MSAPRVTSGAAYAELLLRRDLQAVADASGLTVREVRGIHERLAAATPGPKWTRAKGHPTLGRRHAHIEQAIASLEAAIDRDIVRRQIAELKGRIPIRRHAVDEPGEHPCPDCDRVCRTVRGLAIHRGRDHKDVS